MADSLRTFNKRNPATPQTEKAAKGQKRNNAGGFSFKVSDLDRIKRFLILGSEKSYYQSGAKLTKQNAENVIKYVTKSSANHRHVTDLVVEYSIEGRAPKQNPGLFVLAILASHGTPADKSYALAQLNKVARTGTTLFLFVDYVTQFRGWGRGLRNAVASWYTAKDADKLAYQLAKYQQREGWSHRDVARLTHPKSEDAGVNAAISWAVKGLVDKENTPRVIKQLEAVKGATPAEVEKFLNKKSDKDKLELSWEMLPTEALNNVKVWEILLDAGQVPLGALIRQLRRLTKIGVLKPLGKYTKLVVDRLNDEEELKRARIHPLNVLNAKRAYQGVKIERGGYWASTTGGNEGIPEVVSALEEAFYKSFKFVEPANKRTLIGIDCSGSMTQGIAGTSLTAMEASSALAMTTIRTEPQTHVVGFSGSGSAAPLRITKTDNLDSAIRKVNSFNWGATDCAAPILYASKNNLEVDTFIVLTDNETYAGSIHPFEALNQYRKATGIDARLIVVGMTSGGFTIADPDDNCSLDIAGFDSATPKLIAEFSRGSF